MHFATLLIVALVSQCSNADEKGSNSYLNFYEKIITALRSLNGVEEAKELRGMCDAPPRTPGPHPMPCLQEFWAAAGCTPRGSSAPHKVPANVEWWNARVIFKVRQDMALYKQYANDGDADYIAKCLGTEVDCASTSGPGPHDMQCLHEWWAEAGCRPQGSSAPDKVPANVEWWNARTVDTVKQDMSDYREYANSGDAGYIGKCFGPSVDCDAQSGAGPHYMDCLREWWNDVGCKFPGSNAPDNKPDVDWWQARPVEQVKSDMGAFKSHADRGSAEYREKCYGSVDCAGALGAGPHDMDCLRQWWAEVGCNFEGTHAPDHRHQSDMDWWQARSGAEVQADMALFRLWADNGNEGYPLKCYG